MFCKYCGKEIKDDTRFCPYCGKDQMPDETEDAGTNKDQAFKKQNTAATSSEKQKSKKQTSQGSHPTIKTGPVIAVIAVVIVAVVFIFGITRNSETTNETGTVNEQASTNETGVNGTGSYSSNTIVTAWVVGEGRTSVDSVTTTSNNKTSTQDQINTISSHFNDYEIADPYMDSAANASYRMFELLCVIAEEQDSSGTYANAVAESASSRYKMMDTETSYANIQVVNGLYRCAEMLSSILYELEGDESISEIDSIMSTIISNPNADNSLECKQSVTTAIVQLLYYIAYALDLPENTLDDIDTNYNTWIANIAVIENEEKMAIYDVNERKSLENLKEIFLLIDYTNFGLDSDKEYVNEIKACENEFFDTADSCQFYMLYNALPDETEEFLWEATLFDVNMRLLGIEAELLSN